MDRVLNLLVLLIFALFGGASIVLVGCADRIADHVSPLLISGGNPAAGLTLDQALADVRGFQAPDNVDSELFDQLRDELERQLAGQPGFRAVSRVPFGPRNTIDDFGFELGSNGGVVYSWGYKNVGDYDLNSEVNIADLTPIVINFGRTVDGSSPVRHVDGDGNGEINAADVTPIALNYMCRIRSYILQSNASSDGSSPWVDFASVPVSAMDRSSGFPMFTFGATGICPLLNMRVVPTDGAELGIGSDGVQPELPPEPQPPTLSGTVTDPDGTPVTATVSLPEFEPVTADAEGRFAFSGVQPQTAYAVSFEADGFTETTVNVQTTEAAQQDISAVMLPVEFEMNFTAESLVQVGTPSGATLRLEPGDLVNESGQPMLGSGTASLTFIDVTDPVQRGAAPGDFTAIQQDQSEVNLESFGMVGVQLEDTSGGELNLGEGKDAPLTFPVADDLRGNAPPTIGLYSFDEATGKWIEEGTAVLDGSGDFYEAVVTHFSTWNCDRPLEGAAIHVVVENLAGTRIEGACVEARGVDYTGNSYGTTNAEGIACMQVRRDSEIEVSATWFDDFSDYYTTRSPMDTSTCVDPGQTPIVATVVLDNIITYDPIARFSADPRQGEPPLLVTFDGSQSTDPDGGSILAWEWDWDGEANGWDWQLEQEPVVQHEFTADDQHVYVTLRVTDDEFRVAYTTMLICLHDDHPLPF